MWHNSLAETDPERAVKTSVQRRTEPNRLPTPADPCKMLRAPVHACEVVLG